MWIIFIGASVTNILYVLMGNATRAKWDMLPEEWTEYKTKLDQEKEEKRAKALEKKAKKQEERAKKAGPST